MKYASRPVNLFSADYKSWLKGLHDEDIMIFGSIVNRPQEALNLLYNIYRGQND